MELNAPDHHQSPPGLTSNEVGERKAEAMAWFVALMLVALAARLFDPVGWMGSDDTSYHAAAEFVLAGETMERVHHHFARSPIVLATSLSMAIFGNSVSAAILPSLICSLAGIWLVVLIGRQLSGWFAGLLAGTVFAFIPVVQNNATSLLTGAYTTVFVALGLYMGIRYCRREENFRSWLWAIGAGVACGAAISTKLFAAPVVLAIVATGWALLGWQRRVVHLSAGVVIGIGAFAILECTFYAIVAGDFLYKLAALEVARGAHSGGNFGSQAYESFGTTVQMFWHRISMPLRFADSLWGYIGVLFLPATFVAVAVDRRAMGLGIWILVTYFGVGFVPISFKDGLHVFPGMFFDGVNLLVLCVPMALCTGVAIHWVIEKCRRESWLVKAWPVVLLGVAAISNYSRVECKPARELPQQVLARAVSAIADADPFDGEEPIFIAALDLLAIQNSIPAAMERPCPCRGIC